MSNQSMIWNLVLVFALLNFSAAQPTCPDPTIAQIQECVVPVVQEAERLGLGIQGASRNGQASMLPKIGKQVFLELCK